MGSTYPEMHEADTDRWIRRFVIPDRVRVWSGCTRRWERVLVEFDWGAGADYLERDLSRLVEGILDVCVGDGWWWWWCFGGFWAGWNAHLLIRYWCGCIVVCSFHVGGKVVNWSVVLYDYELRMVVELRDTGTAIMIFKRTIIFNLVW